MVVSAHHEASEVGRHILQAGGNAVDAAVAVGYALAVVDPCCGNIGGGGFMLIRKSDGTATVINFREKAPSAATPTMFLDAAGNAIREASLYGYRAAGVPGTVMGLDRALVAYGRLGRAAVLAPAIRLARDGFALGPADSAILAARAPRLVIARRRQSICWPRRCGTPMSTATRRSATPPSSPIRRRTCCRTRTRRRYVLRSTSRRRRHLPRSGPESHPMNLPRRRTIRLSTAKETPSR